MKAFWLVLSGALVSLQLHAAPPAAVHSCEGLDSIANLVGQVKSFANRDIRVAYITTEEPAAAPDHLLIFIYDNEMSYTCSAVSASASGAGYSSIDWDGLQSSYDPNRGLLLTVPVSLYDQRAGSVPAGRIKVRINRSTNPPRITVE